MAALIRYPPLFQFNVSWHPTDAFIRGYLQPGRRPDTNKGEGGEGGLEMWGLSGGGRDVGWALLGMTLLLQI